MSVETLPPEYTFGKVVGRIIHAVADTAEDEDDKPEARAAAGTVTFTPREKMRVVTTAGHEAIVTHGAESANLSATGSILDAEGRQGIWLVTGTYDVTFKLNPYAGQHTALDKMTITVTAEHTDAAPLDLARAVPYTPPAGTTVRTMLVPSGGTDGQVLTLSGGALAWVTPPSGGGGGADLTTYTQVSSLPDYPTTFPADLSSLATVATTGSYADLAGKPTIPTMPTWSTLTGKPATFPPSAHGHPAADVTGLAPVATSGAYADLTGKPTIPAAPTWDTLTGKPAVIAAGTSATAARDAIGAGTSNLQLGTGPTTAKAGDWKPTWGDVTSKPSTYPPETHSHAVADLPAGTTLSVTATGTTWPTRPTTRTDVVVQWIDHTGTAGVPPAAIEGTDVVIIPAGA